ncbi:MAG: ATP-binding protein [Thermodesulfobacteriota bacterium]|nr:ATP-binding protein [Thermodesulfobacteriota bacterium]
MSSKELTIISGKGGTGKTSIVASLATLAENKVLVDADVDAADLHLVIAPTVKQETDFQGGSIAVIDPDQCTRCGECIERCRFDAISDNFVVDRIACEGCGVCVHFCPVDAIDFPRQICGKWYVSDTRHGTMVHARLGIAEENSGLLVSLLRKEAKNMAELNNHDLILVDGPPGIGCPVISSVTNSSAVLVISEPTMSGMHDMKRVNELATFLKVPVMFCINKYDINEDIAEEIKQYGKENNMDFVGAIPYDKEVTAAMVKQQSLVEYSDGKAARAVKDMWQAVSGILDNQHN